MNSEVAFTSVLMQAGARIYCCLLRCAAAPNQAFLNIDEVSHFLAPTVPFILGRLGIPIFGNKAIPSWLWRSPNDHFFPFLSQAENDLPPHGQRLAGTEPGPLIEERTWLHTRQLPLSLPLSFRLSSSSFLSLTVFGGSFSYSVSNVLFFHRHLHLCTASLPVPHLHSPPFSPPVFQMIPRYSSWSPGGCPNPSFSTPVHRPLQKSSEETVTEQVCKPRVEFRILFTFLSCSDRRAVNLRFDKSVAHKSVFMRPYFLSCDNMLYRQMLHECIWPYLIGRGLVQ